MIGIYKITNPNGLVYIGQSSDIEKRRKQYERCACHSQTKLYNSIRKYGWDNHRFEILMECDLAEINEMEKYYGELYDCVKTGLNLKECGGNRQLMSEETKRNMSKPHTLTDQQRFDLSERMKKLHTGKAKSAECAEKVRQSKIGIARPEWVRRKVSEGRKDKKAIISIKDCAIIEYPSLCTASKELNRDRKTINQALAKGFNCNGHKLYYL